MHYSILVDDHDYRTEYPILVGGVIVFRPENFIKLNGYSNVYWGWGAEDDDMHGRMQHKTALGFDRPKNNVKYTMLKHTARWKNPNRVRLLGDKRDFKYDGLSNVNYTINSIIKYRMHTHLLIESGLPPSQLVKT